MQIDWTTFALEIVNFLALVWLLKRFLYTPVLDVLARRRAGVEQLLAESRASEARARALQGEFERRLADWEDEKARARAQLDADLAGERALGVQVLSRALAEERERSAAVDAHQRQQLEQQRDIQAMAQAQRFTAALLGRIADPAVEASLLDRFLDDWAGLPDEQIDKLRRAAGEPGAVAEVTSAFALSAAQRQRIAGALAARLQREIAVHYREDGRLLSGLRVSLGAWHLQMNFADELSRFAAVPNHDG